MAVRQAEGHLEESEPYLRGQVCNRSDDAAGARRCGGCAAYASIARPQCPSTAGSCSRCRASRRCAYWYNQAHLHSALGHVPPLEFERAHGRQVTPRSSPLPGEPALYFLLNPRAVQDAAITQPEFSFASRTINAW